MAKSRSIWVTFLTPGMEPVFHAFKFHIVESQATANLSPLQGTASRNPHSRLVVGRKRDGRCEYDEAVDEWVRQCLQPGISIARMTSIDHVVTWGMQRRVAGTLRASRISETTL